MRERETIDKRRDLGTGGLPFGGETGEGRAHGRHFWRTRERVGRIAAEGTRGERVQRVIVRRRSKKDECGVGLAVECLELDYPSRESKSVKSNGWSVE